MREQVGFGRASAVEIEHERLFRRRRFLERLHFVGGDARAFLAQIEPAGDRDDAAGFEMLLAHCVNASFQTITSSWP